MDSKPRRTISDIRPARSMDGVTPSGNRRPSQLPSRPSTQAAEPATESAAAVPESLPQSPEVMPIASKTAVAPRPVKRALPEAVTPVAPQEKKKSGLVKKVVKVVIGFIVLGLVAAGGWMVYVNYFR